MSVIFTHYLTHPAVVFMRGREKGGKGDGKGGETREGGKHTINIQLRPGAQKDGFPLAREGLFARDLCAAAAGGVAGPDVDVEEVEVGPIFGCLFFFG